VNVFIYCVEDGVIFFRGRKFDFLWVLSVSTLIRLDGWCAIETLVSAAQDRHHLSCVCRASDEIVDVFRIPEKHAKEV
jgi:hypothetical protein